jgi:hypothetical protein
VSALQRPVLYLEVSATGPELHPDVSVVCTTEACAVPGGVYTTEPELHSDVSALQRSVLFLEVSTCLIHMDQCILTVERVRFASKIKFFLANVFDSLRK